MRIAIIGAAGQAGSLIAAEATSRGHDVVGFGRSHKGAVTVVKDVFELTAADLAGFDAVVDALGFFTEDTLPLHVSSLNHLLDLLSDTPTRLLVVGGAGSLYVDAEHSTQLLDTPDFPEAYLALAKAQAKQLDVLRGRNDVSWTYLSPAAEFVPDRARTGSYALGGERFETNAEGRSVLSYADYAVAMVDEIEQARHINQRIGVYES